MLNILNNESMQESTSIVRTVLWQAITKYCICYLRLDNKKIKSLQNVKSFKKRQILKKFDEKITILKVNETINLIMV